MRETASASLQIDLCRRCKEPIERRRIRTNVAVAMFDAVKRQDTSLVRVQARLPQSSGRFVGSTTVSRVVSTNGVD
jgi:hypothetical protein